MRKLLFGLGFGLIAALPAQAQVMRSCSDPYIPCMQDIRPIGVQMHARLPAGIEGDQCGKAGCIIVINKSAGYDITQFYVNDGKRDAANAPVWGYNQFEKFSLDPMRAVWTPRPRKMKCALTVKVVLRDRKTKEEVEGVQEFDLCGMKDRGFAVFEIALARPGEVILEDSPEDKKS
jgi:hypothetical protein